MKAEIDKVYRINRQFAKLRNVPRDVLIHCVRKKNR